MSVTLVSTSPRTVALPSGFLPAAHGVVPLYIAFLSRAWRATLSPGPPTLCSLSDALSGPSETRPSELSLSLSLSLSCVVVSLSVFSCPAVGFLSTHDSACHGSIGRLLRFCLSDLLKLQLPVLALRSTSAGTGPPLPPRQNTRQLLQHEYARRYRAHPDCPGLAGCEQHS